MILSILICTIPKRKIMFDRLFDSLSRQADGSIVQIISDDQPGTIGAKRQRLIESAKGDYVVFIDDDDLVTTDYVRVILNAIESRPDVIGFYGWITTNGKHQKQFKISKDCEYVDTPRRYDRFNNHLSPVKRSIALQIGYKDISWQEDYDYAVRLKESGLVKTEVFIPKSLYFYRYVTKKSYS